MDNIAFTARIVVKKLHDPSSTDHYPISGEVLIKWLQEKNYAVESVHNYLDNEFQPVIILTEIEPEEVKK